MTMDNNEHRLTFKLQAISFSTKLVLQKIKLVIKWKKQLMEMNF